MKYTTKAKVEQYLSTTITSDIEHYISAMSRHMDKMADRTLVVDTSLDPVAKKYSGNGKTGLIVDDFVELVSLTIDGSVVDENDFITEPANAEHKNYIVLRNGGRFYRDMQNVVVTGHFGLFAKVVNDDEIEADIEHACTVLVAGIVQNSNNPEGIVRSESIGRYTVTYTTDKQAKDFEFALNTINYYRKESF